ncbi:MAG TPA: TetR/AcrR family transcriptional regulator [Acidimicrobiales bacterium]|nr:TetR/AcrR family transcriptional regulator [Acidimicrobiales bacterium]
MATSRTARSARERVREEMTAEILAVAREHLAKEGGAALSLRSVARDLELAPSALYRYFDGRDALLSALIMAAYESLAAETERAADQAHEAGNTDVEAWLEVPRAARRWALERPHEWALIFGTPVPGYEAPEDTVEPYARAAAALARPVMEAKSAGRLHSDVSIGAGARTDTDAYELRRAVAPVAEGLSLDLPVPTVVRLVQAWATVIGLISLEIFGHWRNTILDPEAFFEAAVRNLAADLGLA